MNQIRIICADYIEREARAALAAAVRSTETRSRLGPQGRQSGPKGNAQKDTQ